MLSLIPFLWKRLEHISVLCITFAFWILATLALTNMQGTAIRPIVLVSVSICCLFLLGFIDIRSWKTIGTPGLLIMATMTSYLIISSTVSLITGTELEIRDVARLALFSTVTLSAILGGRFILERIGVEALLKWMLVILIISSTFILATPVLQDLGFFVDQSLRYRYAGAFTDPNNAGFIASITVAIGTIFVFYNRRYLIGYLAQALGVLAAFHTFSKTSILVLAIFLVSFLLSNISRLRQGILCVGLTVLCLASIGVYYFNPLALTLHSTDCTFTTYRVHGAEQDTLTPGKDYTVEVRPLRDQKLGDTVRFTTTAGIDHTMLIWQTPVENKTITLYHYRLGPKDGQWQQWRTFIPYQCASPQLEKPDNVDQPSIAVQPPQETTPLTSTSEEVAASGNTPIVPDLQPGLKQSEVVKAIRGESSRTDSSMERRIREWESGIEKALESPIFGHGLDQLHSIEGNPIQRDGRPEGVHNVYIMLLGEAGIIPILLFVLGLFSLIRIRWTMTMSLTRDIVTGLVIMLGLFALPFQHFLTMGSYNFLLGLSCAMAAILIQQQSKISATT